MLLELSSTLISVGSLYFTGVYGILVLVVCFTCIAYMYGAFSGVKLNKSYLSKSQVAFIEFKGNYESDLIKEFEKATADLKELKSTKYVEFGKYYDNPDVVGKDNCRGVVGLLAEGCTFEPDHLRTLQLKGYKIAFVELDEAIRADLPNISFYSMIFSIKRFYDSFFSDFGGVMKKFEVPETHQHFFIEIYRDSTITFLFPIAQENPEVYLHSSVKADKMAK